MKIQRIQCMEETLHHLIKNLSTGVLRWTTINNVTKLSADDVPRLTMSELVVDWANNLLILNSSISSMAKLESHALFYNFKKNPMGDWLSELPLL